VGIGGQQTGVYPLASPGGWQIIGRTPLRLFAAERPEPALLRMGDQVRFRAISAGELRALAGEG
jgi:inhibitor of KinA